MTELTKEWIKAHFGNRCTDYEPGCAVCEAYKFYDYWKDPEDKIIIISIDFVHPNNLSPYYKKLIRVNNFVLDKNEILAIKETGKGEFIFEWCGDTPRKIMEYMQKLANEDDVNLNNELRNMKVNGNDNSG